MPSGLSGAFRGLSGSIRSKLRISNPFIRNSAHLLAGAAFSMFISVVMIEFESLLINLDVDMDLLNRRKVNTMGLFLMVKFTPR